MKHNYNLYRLGEGWGNGVAMPMPEEAIRTLVFYDQIVHVKSVHVGKDTEMSHYFVFKEKP